MNVLLQSRKTLFTVPGGDTIQMLKTAAALREKGCAATISTDLEPDLSGYDIVHLFNLTRPQELYLQAVNARRQNRRIALSPVYVSYREYEQCARGGFFSILARHLDPGKIEYLKILARSFKNLELNKGTLLTLLRGYRTLQDRIIDMADILLPNSESEMNRASSDMDSIPYKRYIIVPNAVDENVFNLEGSGDANSEYPDCVLCVARIDGVKNQLNLVRAMKGLPWTLLLIGKPANHRSYFAHVKNEAGSNVRFIDKIEHSALPSYYKTARVHVLASWMETTGLSSLEAGAMGCNLVITDKGDTREYFGNYAFYCEPDSVESIRAAIIKAYDAPINPQLRHHIIDNFTWAKAAEKTLEGYHRTLNMERPH